MTSWFNFDFLKQTFAFTEQSVSLSCNNPNLNTCFYNVFDHFFPHHKSEECDVIEQKMTSIYPEVMETFRSGKTWISSLLASATESCFLQNCPNVDLKDEDFDNKLLAYFKQNFPPLVKVHPFLKSQEAELKKKVLVVSAAHDPKSILNPSVIKQVLTKFSKEYNLRYAVVSKFDQACQLIQKTGKLLHVAFLAYGNSENFMLGSNERVTSNIDFKTCFSGLLPYGKISLLSSKTGAEDTSGRVIHNNIAQKIADSSKRIVMAPTETIYTFFMDLETDSDMLYHPQSRFFPFSKNIFKVFTPTFTQCFRTRDFDLTDQEIKVSKAFDTHFPNFHLHPTTTQPFHRLCSDDPREKLLFLASQTDSFKPEHIATSLLPLASQFDFKYKVILSTEEICTEIEQASKIGTLANVIIQGIGNSEDGLLVAAKKIVYGGFLPPSQRRDSGVILPEQRINGNNVKFLECFSKLKKDARIIFLGSSLGHQLSAKKTSIAQKVANQVQRTVVASTTPIYLANIKFQHLDPLSPTYTSTCSMLSKVTFTCSKEDATTFKVFNPKK